MTVTKIRYRALWIAALILMGFLITATGLQAQTIHVIIAADTNADRAGKEIAQSTRIDQENFEKVFRANVPESQLTITTVPVDEMWAPGILKVVDDLAVANEDTVVFFYTGHGAYDTEAKQQFFQLSLDSGGKPYPGKKDLFRNEVVDRLRKKSARLCVVISDCCNTQATARKSDWFFSRQAELLPRSPKTISPLFESLFIMCKGLVDVTSSKLGEASGINGDGKGSCFTSPLVDLLTVHKDDDSLDWKTLLDKLTPKVQEAFLAAYPKGAMVQGGRQYKQTVFAYSLPGMSATRRYDETQTVDSAPSSTVAPETRKGPRFGVRAVAEKDGGLRITELIADSPGKRAGLEVGDVLLEINEKSINSEPEYSDAVDESPKQMHVKVKKRNNGGDISTLTVELGW